MADEAHTDPSQGGMKTAGQQFQQMIHDGIEVRTGRGHPIMVSYPMAGLDNPRMHEMGGHHAKVMISEQSRLAFVGSTNFTQASRCNIEMTAKIRLTPSGLQELMDWFDRCWENSTAFVLSGGSSGSRSVPSRSPTRAGSRGAARAFNAGHYQPPA